MSEEKAFEIKNAKIVDQSLVYSYTIMDGVNKGDLIPNRKGVNIVHEDLQQAMSKLVVFLAHVDGAYHWSNNQTPLQELEDDKTTEDYDVVGFSLSGAEENQSVIIKGSKKTPYGIMDIETPKIKLNGAYLYLADLDDKLKTVISEVELYHNGKIAPKYEQQAIEFEHAETDFESAKVK